jgi:YVTN family beta-propeller protein
MTLEKILIRRLILLGAFAFVTTLAAAQTPSPALLITIQGPGERALQIADPVTMKVVASVPMGGNPHQVAASADGKLAFVTIENGGWMPGRSEEELNDPSNQYISVIDLMAQKELRRVKTGLGSFPHGIAFGGGKVYFVSEGYRAVKRYDPASDQIEWEIGIGQVHPHMIAITKDLKIFTSNEGGTVTAIEHWEPSAKKVLNNTSLITTGRDPHSPWEVTTIPVTKKPEGMAISPDEKEIWVAGRIDGNISIIDVATLKVSQALKSTLRIPISLRFTPDGKRVIVADSASGEIVVFDAATRMVIKRIELGKPEQNYQSEDGESTVNGVEIETKNKIQDVLIPPDGSRAYLNISGSDRIAIIDLKTLGVTGSISVGREPEGLGWAERK